MTVGGEDDVTNNQIKQHREKDGEKTNGRVEDKRWQRNKNRTK